MNIKNNCPHCQAEYEVELNLAGTKIACPTCNKSFMIKLPPLGQSTKSSESAKISSQSSCLCDVCNKEINDSEKIIVKTPIIQKATDNGYISPILRVMNNSTAQNPMMISPEDQWQNTVKDCCGSDWALCSSCNDEIADYCLDKSNNHSEVDETDDDKVGDCYFCGKYQSSPGKAVKVTMFRVLGRSAVNFFDEYKVTYETRTVKIPRCTYCAEIHKGGGVMPLGCGVAMVFFWLVPAVMSLLMEGTILQKGLAFAIFTAFIILSIYCIIQSKKKENLKNKYGIKPKSETDAKMSNWPFKEIRQLKADGWTLNPPTG